MKKIMLSIIVLFVTMRLFAYDFIVETIDSQEYYLFYDSKSLETTLSDMSRDIEVPMITTVNDMKWSLDTALPNSVRQMMSENRVEYAVTILTIGRTTYFVIHKRLLDKYYVFVQTFFD